MILEQWKGETKDAEGDHIVVAPIALVHLLHVSPATVTLWVQQGKFRDAVVVGSRLHLLKAESVLRFIEKRSPEVYDELMGKKEAKDSGS